MSDYKHEHDRDRSASSSSAPTVKSKSPEEEFSDGDGVNFPPELQRTSRATQAQPASHAAEAAPSSISREVSKRRLASDADLDDDDDHISHKPKRQRSPDPRKNAPAPTNLFAAGSTHGQETYVLSLFQPHGPYRIRKPTLFIFTYLCSLEPPGEQERELFARVIDSGEMMKYMGNELKIQTLLLQHPCKGIPTLLDMGRLTNTTFLVYNESVADNLHGFMNSVKKLDELRALKIFRQIAVVIRHLHRHGIAYRDLKLTRIGIQKPYLDDHGELQTEQILFLCFDSCRFVQRNVPYREHHSSPAYVAPEVLNGKTKSEDVPMLDMWSLGVILYIFVVGAYPFHNDSPAVLFQKITNLEYDQDALDATPRAKDIISRLLVQDPHDRLEATQLVTLVQQHITALIGGDDSGDLAGVVPTGGDHEVPSFDDAAITESQAEKPRCESKLTPRQLHATLRKVLVGTSVG
eukprot:m.47823 g.47823  ORF g.47823 m.47823 type:complete len:464 (+) comp6384_c0_seq1:1169-2560(+)